MNREKKILIRFKCVHVYQIHTPKIIDNCQGAFGHSRLSSLSHCGLILA